MHAAIMQNFKLDQSSFRIFYYKVVYFLVRTDRLKKCADSWSSCAGSRRDRLLAFVEVNTVVTNIDATPAQIPVYQADVLLGLAFPQIPRQFS